MTYTGSWLRNAYVDPKAGYVPTADPGHGVTDADDPNAYVYDAPPLTEPGPVGEYPGIEWVVNTIGTVIDRTDYTSHEASTADEGAAHQGYYSQYAPTQGAGETYQSVHFQSLPGQTVSNAALRRGLNSLPENNPEGFPVGDQQVNTFAVHRKFLVGERVHDRRIMTPNVAGHAANVPAPKDGNPYTQPFDSLARPMSRIFQRPEIRREPVPVSDDLLTDGTGQAQLVSPALNTWVVG